MQAEAVEQHSRQADQFAARYERLGHSPYGSCFAYSRYRLAAWLDALLPRAGSPLRALDVGCGTGHYLAELRRRGLEATGLDGSAEMLRHAQAAAPDIALQRASVEALPFRDQSFHVALCVEVLRYLPRVETCVREMYRVLKPGGICLATAAPALSLNGYAILNRLALAAPLPRLVRLKQYFHTSRRLRRAFLEAGFSSVTLHGVYFGPVNWVERLAPPLLPAALARWERVDRALADRAPWREMSNMFLVRAVRGAQ